MSNIIEQFESTTNKNQPSVRFDDASKYYKEDMGALQMQKVAEASTRMTADGQLPPMQIGDFQKAQIKPDISEHAVRRAAADEAANAERQLPDLMKKADKKDGLTDKDLDKLAKDDTLTPEQKRAVKYMRDNYETLQTGGWRFADKITPESLKEHAKDATKVDPRRTEDAKRAIEEVIKPKPGEVEVKAGWGWYRIAEESLRKQGKTAGAQDILKETERLHKLNPDKVRMVHPGDKIKIN